MKNPKIINDIKLNYKYLLIVVLLIIILVLNLVVALWFNNKLNKINSNIKADLNNNSINSNVKKSMIFQNY